MINISRKKTLRNLLTRSYLFENYSNIEMHVSSQVNLKFILDCIYALYSKSIQYIQTKQIA